MPLPPETTVMENADAVAAAAAALIRDLAASGAPVAIALSGGSTPQRLYQMLAEPAFASTLRWEAIHWFFGDDRFVPLDHADSNAGVAKRMLLDRVPVPAVQVHPMAKPGLSLEEAARACEADLDAFAARFRKPGEPLFDLVLLGLGSDGHTASLFPGKPALDVRDRLVTAVPEAGMEPFVPRITLTYRGLASSRRIVFLVTGAGKQQKVSEIAAGADYPARRVTSAGRVEWWMDRAAAGAAA